MNEKLSEILKPESGCISEDILFRYAEGKLSADEVRRVEAHLADCDFCSDALEGMMIGDLEKSKKGIEEVRTKIREKAVARKTFTLRRVMQIAAVMVLLAVSGWFVNLMIQKPAEQIFTDQFQPYPAPQDNSGIQEAPPSVNESKISPEEDKKQSTQSFSADQSSSSEAKPEAEKKEQAEKKSPEATFKQTQAVEEVSPQGNIESANAPADDHFIQQSRKSDSVLDFSKSGYGMTESAPVTANESGKANSLDEVVIADANSAKEVVTNNFNKGMKYYKENRYAEAIAEFQLVLQQEPGHVEANFYSGVSSLALNNPKEALKYFKKTDVKGTQFYEATLWYQALSYINMSDKKQAKNLLEKVIELNGEYKARAEETLKQL